MIQYYNRLKVTGFLLILPVLVFFLTFSVYPVISAFVISFFKYDLFNPMRWTGFGNYTALFKDKNFWSALKVTITYTASLGPLTWIMSFIMALLVKEKIAGRRFFRSVYFIPTILSAVAMATVWSLLLRKNGPINAVLGTQVRWLTNQRTALWGIVIMSIWQKVGWFMVILLAGLQNIPQSYYEAARIDGANRLQEMRYITLPMLRPVFALVVIWTIIDGIKVFTPMFIMTGGGPNNATRSLSMLIYHKGLKDLSMGRASAISIFGFLVVLVLTIIQLRLFRVEKEVGE